MLVAEDLDLGRWLRWRPLICSEGGMLFDPNQTTVRWLRSIFNRTMPDIRMQDLGSDEVLRNNAVRSSFILLVLISVFGISAVPAQETIDVAKIT